MSEHTPGPWSHNGPVGEVFDEYGQSIAMVLQYSDSGEANSRLIAAAPEMLEALEYVRANGHPALYKVILPVIAKAYGGVHG